MPASFFRVERGFEISDEIGQSLVQLLTGTAAPDLQTDAVAAPVGSLWLVNSGTSSTTRVYQRFQLNYNDRRDWRDVTNSLSWREAAEVCAPGSYKPLTTKGYQEVQFSVAKTLTSSTGLVATQGTQVVDVGGAVTLATATGLANDASLYNASIVVDGGGSQTITITGSEAQTYADLILQLDIDTAGASWSIVGGNLQATSDSFGTTSTIAITDGPATNLFSSLTGFVAVNAATAGTDTTYTATVDVDGGGPQAISVDASNAQTFAELISELDTDTTGASWHLIDGNLQAISDSTGTTSTIDIVDTDLFSTLTNFSAIAPAVTGAALLVDATAVTDGMRVLFSEIAGYDSFFVTPPTLGSTTTAATTQTYSVDVTFDTGGLQQLVATVTNGDTYTTIAASFNAQIAAGTGTLVYDDQTSAFVAISATTDNTSTAILAAGTGASAGGDLFAALAAADSLTFTAGPSVNGTGGDIYVYSATLGKFVPEPGNLATDGDAVFIQSGTCADSSYFFNGTQWVPFGSGTAEEEGFIRDFIGKDTPGAETPDYENPTESATGDEPADLDPFTDATGQGTATASNGYVVHATDNLELAIAKLNNEIFQNNRHLFVGSATSAVDTLPTYVDGVKWLARVQEGNNVQEAEIHAVTDGTSVDYSVFSKLKIGGNIAGLAWVVTVVSGALVLTVTSTNPSSFQIRRLGTTGVANAGSVTGIIQSLHV